MIARVWRGEVESELAQEYLELMRSIALPDYRSVPGNLGAWCLLRRGDHVTEFKMVSTWASLRSVEAFAGNEIDRAKYYEFDQRYLRWLEPTVGHFEVYSDEWNGPSS
jgi:hypothetical protein